MAFFWSSSGSDSRAHAPSSSESPSTTPPAETGSTAPNPPSSSQENAPDDFTTANSLISDIVFDPKFLHPIVDAKVDPQYIYTEEAPSVSPSEGFVPSRGWSDDLCYGVGTVYLLGMGLGGIWGTLDGLNPALRGLAFRIRWNAILNGATRRGPFFGNSLGALAIIYNTLNHGMAKLRNGKHDMINQISAATFSGLIFKSTAGLRSAGMAGAICGGTAAVWYGSKALRPNIPALGALASRSYA